MQENEKKKKKKIKRVVTSTSPVKTQIRDAGSLIISEGKRRLSNGKGGGSDIVYGNGYGYGYDYGYGD